MENRQPLDDRADSFLQVGDVAYHVAETHAGVLVDETTHERWRQLMALLREFDTLVDDTAISQEEALARLHDFTEFEARYQALRPEELGGETFGRLYRRTERVLKLGHFVAAADTPERFVALRVNEGRQTANLLQDSATDYVSSQENFSTRFLPAIRSLGATACTLDSITDARQDYLSGKINITPDAKYYRQLAGASLAHAAPGTRALLHRPVMRQFVIMSAARLRNRITNGVSPSSSLHNFSTKGK